MWDDEGSVGARRVIIAAIVALVVGLAIAFAFVFFILPFIGKSSPDAQTADKTTPEAKKINQLQQLQSGSSTNSESDAIAKQKQLQSLESGFTSTSTAGEKTNVTQTKEYQDKLNKLNALQGN